MQRLAGWCNMQLCTKFALKSYIVKIAIGCTHTCSCKWFLTKLSLVPHRSVLTMDSCFESIGSRNGTPPIVSRLSPYHSDLFGAPLSRLLLVDISHLRSTHQGSISTSSHDRQSNYSFTSLLISQSPSLWGNIPGLSTAGSWKEAMKIWSNQVAMKSALSTQQHEDLWSIIEVGAFAKDWALVILQTSSLARQ